MVRQWRNNPARDPRFAVRDVSFRELMAYGIDGIVEKERERVAALPEAERPYFGQLALPQAIEIVEDEDESTRYFWVDQGEKHLIQ